MVTLEPYYFEPNILQFRNDGIEDIEVENRLEKLDFADLVKDSKSVAGFISLPPIFRVGPNDVT